MEIKKVKDYNRRYIINFTRTEQEWIENWCKLGKRTPLNFLKSCIDGILSMVEDG